MTLVLAPNRARFDRFCAIAGLRPEHARFAPVGTRVDADSLSAAKGGAIVLTDMHAARLAGERLAEAGADPEMIFTAADPLRLFDAVTTLGSNASDPAKLVERLIAEDFLERAYYAYPLIVAAAQARRLGLSSLCVVEFGVWEGAGLLNMASLCALIERSHGIAFRVVGFDTGGGMPSPEGWPDHPEIWHEGDLKLPDSEALRGKLPPNTELILGDVSETVPRFMATLAPDCPLGFVALDLDFYSSSVAALRVFDNRDQSVYLPAVPLYVDDSYVGVTQHELSGEGLAIHMHNLPNMRKLEAGSFDDVQTLILKKQVRPRSLGRIWHHCMYFAHMCQHPVRNKMGEFKLAGLRHTSF